MERLQKKMQELKSTYGLDLSKVNIKELINKIKKTAPLILFSAVFNIMF